MSSDVNDEAPEVLEKLYLDNNSLLPPGPCCVNGGGGFFPWGKGGQHEAVRMFQSQARLCAETVKSNRDWAADLILEVVVLPDDS